MFDKKIDPSISKLINASYKSIETSTFEFNLINGSTIIGKYISDNDQIFLIEELDKYTCIPFNNVLSISIYK